MKLTRLANIYSTLHCQPRPGADRVIALFMYEGIYLLESGKSASTSILGSLVGWTNPDQRRRLIQSGRCRFNLTLT
jgi:hypothetical protein